MASPSMGHFEKVRALCASARLVYVAGARTGKTSQITLYEAGGKLVRAVPVPAHVHALLLHGERLVAACADGALRVYSAEGDREYGALPGHAGGATALCAAEPDHIYSAGMDGAVRRWSLAQMAAAAAPSKAVPAALQLSAQPLRAVAADAALSYLAAAGDDGVVHAVSLQDGARRDMPGHAGAVLALAFTADGRVVSGGEDATLRIWYLVGAIECETRGATSDGHGGPVQALLIPRVTLKPKDDGTEAGERIFSAGADGKVKVWRLDERRKPRTIEYTTRPLCALGFAPPPSSSAARNGVGMVLSGGDTRTVWRMNLDLQAAPVEGGERAFVYEHGFQAIPAAQNIARPAREAAIRLFCDPVLYEEPESLELLTAHLAAEREAELRALICQEMGKRGRRGARPALRERLNDDNVLVRQTALTALRAIDGESSLVPLRAALGSRHGDLRREALRALTPLRESSPLVPGLIAERLTDGDGEVRLTALECLVRLHPEGSPEPLRLCYERGLPNVKIEALIRAAFGGLLAAPSLVPILARALDDEDSAVRRAAFAVRVLERRALATILLDRDEEFARTTLEILRRGARLLRSRHVTGAEAPTDEEARAARDRLPSSGKGPLCEADLEPLLSAMSCRTAETALRGARGLAKLGDTRALGALLQLSRESAPELRRQAATALRDLSDPRAVKRLLWMLDDRDAGVRGAALDAYAALQPAPLQIAEAALRSSFEDIRVRGLERLVKLPGQPQAEALLGDAIEDEAAKVRGEAFRTLWSWHDKDPIPVLDRALRARFPDLRLRALQELELSGKESWARERLLAAIADLDATVAQAAYDASVKVLGKEAAAPHLSALASIHGAVRAAGAKGSEKVDKSALAEVRAALMKLLSDESQPARTAALEALDHLLPADSAPHYLALQGAHLDLRARAAELLAVRRDERLIEAMRDLLTDKELRRRVPPEVLNPLRERAATALASLGSQRTLKFLATELIKDDLVMVREQAARGMANAARPGDESYLLDGLGHAEVWVRSWVADGLARLGDSRALPVLTGTLRHDHLPIRLASITSFAALGPEGYGGMLQGLEDPSREVQEIVFGIVLSRDLRALRKGQAPDLLTSALSSGRPEVRFAAARALELRGDPETYLTHVIEVLLPPRPEKAADMKDWPAEESRGRMLLGLAEALAGDSAELRYAATQVLRLRLKPLEYFREAQRLGKPRAAGAAVVADNAPRPAAEGDTRPQRGFLRRLFWGPGTDESGKAQGAQGHQGGDDGAPPVITDAEKAHLLRLSFGAYVGLLRQVQAQQGGDDEGHRVRRDAVDRIVELGTLNGGAVGAGAAIPPVLRALDDPHHLVRRAAFAGLKKLFPTGSDQPLALALASVSPDVGRLALDEIFARGEAGKGAIAAALSSALPEVRRYAFELLERLSEKGSLEPLLLALQSEYADLRIGVIERLATQSDPRVIAALQRAMESDHDDLRLRAAELLAERKDDRPVDVLAAFLRVDDARQVERARTALTRIGSKAAVRVLAARLEEVPDTGNGAERAPLLRALSDTRNPEAVDVLCEHLDRPAGGESPFRCALRIAGATAGDDREKRDDALALRVLRAAAKSKLPEVRRLAAEELDLTKDPAGNEILLGLFGDRDAAVRIAAVSQYARRVMDPKQDKGADVAPLKAVVQAGTRELLLPAAEAVAFKGDALALRPLLLLSRAGEPEERPRALLALGTLGDARALEELETVAGGGTKDAPAEVPMQAAAIEALGRLANRLTDPEARRRVTDRVEDAASGGEVEVQQAAVRGVRALGGERARARLEALVTDRGVPDPVRQEAAEQLGQLGDPAAEAALGRALDDWEWDVREAARKALDRLFPGERTRIELLAVGSRHDDISGPAAAYLAVEGDAAVLLGRLPGLKDEALRRRLGYGLLRRPLLPAAGLAGLCAQADPALRREGAWLIGGHAGSRGQALDEASRRALGQALADAEGRCARGWKAPTPIPGQDLDEAREAEARAWVEVLWAATVVGPAPGGPLRERAAKIIGGGDDAAPAAVRCAAVPILTAAGDRAALTAALQDPDASVRAAAAAGLQRAAPAEALAQALAVRPFDPVSLGAVLQGPAQEQGRSLPGLAAALRTSEGRRLLLPALLPGRDEAALAALSAMAKDPDKDQKELRLCAIAALGRMGGEEALALLRRIAFDKDKKAGDEAVRKAAFRAFKRAQRQADKVRKYEAQA